MGTQQLQQTFNMFIARYDAEAKDTVWADHSMQFRDFWNTKIISGAAGELDDSEIDQMIRILDTHGKGNTSGSEAVARVMIAQGAWRRMFNGIKARKDLAALLYQIFLEHHPDQKAEAIDRLYKLNESKHINNLTGPSGNAVCAMLAAFDPVHNLSVISLNDREKLCAFLGIAGGPDFSSDRIGKKIVSSNTCILGYFESVGIRHSARTLSVFFYSLEFKPLWKTDKTEELEPSTKPYLEPSSEVVDPGLFYMESQLEDFLVENWDRTELGTKYDLIEEDGELVSQQYKTDIGVIDILARDKKTGQFVVIELKKSQTSDDTVGQLTRYMGWLEEHKTGGAPTKGIIIAGRYDRRLYYALKKLNGVEIYLYQVDFKLREFKQ
jgi:hypothetical protein